jgi:tetratricopeptide (TPR) repeat protein
VREAWNSGDLEAALVAARAALCQYAIWHKSHTAPIMALGDRRIEKLLAVDIEALSEFVGDVCTLHFRLARQRELPAQLERLRALVADPRWQRKLTYHQALVLDATSAHDEARAEFAKLGPIVADTETDVEILQAHLDLFGADMPFAEKLAVCDRILKLTHSISDHVQYGGVKAMTYAAIGDVGQAKKELALAVAYAHMRAKEKPLGSRAQLLLASALSFLGLFTREERRFVEAEEVFKALLADDGHWSAEGFAMLWDHLGECYRYWGKWAAGDNAYRKALSLHPTGIRSVFLAECVLRLGHKHAAAAILDAVKFEELRPAEQVDYAYITAEIAVEYSDRDRLKTALAVLEGVVAEEPYFEQRRLEFIVAVQAELAKGSTSWQALKDLLAQPLRQLNRYIMLQPNIAGFGLNLNAMIEDALGPKDKETD